jgi:poly-gamma-glutamate capsule biosynthesis protein CapA/YwtB (metallophosphatase superfamily)
VERTDAYARRRRGPRRWARLAGVLCLCAASLAAGYGAHAVVSASGGSAAAPPAQRVPGTTTVTVTTIPPPSPPPGPRTVSIAAVGDTMLGSTPQLPASPSTYLAAMRADLRGDIVFGNLEGTLTDATTSKCKPKAKDCFAFRAPPDFASDLRAAGFTVMNNANNHSSDFGPAGQAATVRALRAAGIAQTGLPGQITVVHARGVRVAIVGFAPYSGTASLVDLPAARALVERAGAMADIVVVAIHAGAEGSDAQHVTGGEESYAGEDRGNAEAFAHMAVDAGADLVLGSGPHVLRGMEIFRGRLIAYSLGNFAGYHNFGLDGVLADSAVLHVHLSAKGAFRSGRITSVRLVGAGMPEPDTAGTGAQLIAELSRDDLGSRAIRVTPAGRIVAP